MQKPGDNMELAVAHYIFAWHPKGGNLSGMIPTILMRYKKSNYQ